MILYCIILHSSMLYYCLVCYIVIIEDAGLRPDIISYTSLIGSQATKPPPPPPPNCSFLFPGHSLKNNVDRFLHQPAS